MLFAGLLLKMKRLARANTKKRMNYKKRYTFIPSAEVNRARGYAHDFMTSFNSITPQAKHIISVSIPAAPVTPHFRTQQAV